MNWKSAVSSIACAIPLLAQTPPVSILEVQVDNVVTYIEDTYEVSKWGSLPGPVPLPPPAVFTATFKQQVMLGDVVSVNGQTMKGSLVGRSRADGGAFDQVFSLMLADGTFLGSIAVPGGNTPVPPPGAPKSAVGGTGIVAGGSGAFLGVRGQAGVVRASGIRGASITENPAFRRKNGGGSITFFLQLMPAFYPEVQSIPTGPAIYHGSDFTPVTADKPARAGEQLIVRATGLGPVRPQLDPGKPFPPYPEGALHLAISPISVTVNGQDAILIGQNGWPDTTGVYRVDFLVPDGTAAGTATVMLNAAFIRGPEVKIPVR